MFDLSGKVALVTGVGSPVDAHSDGKGPSSKAQILTRRLGRTRLPL